MSQSDQVIVDRSGLAACSCWTVTGWVAQWRSMKVQMLSGTAGDRSTWNSRMIFAIVIPVDGEARHWETRGQTARERAIDD